MKKGDILAAFFILLAAAVAVAMGVGLVVGLRNQFTPKPIQYKNSVWQSEDGAFTLEVGEYSQITYECECRLTYTDPQGETYTYSVCDQPYGAMAVYISESEVDSWQRMSCNEKGFTVRLRLNAALQYSDSYGKSEKIKFTRVK